MKNGSGRQFDNNFLYDRQEYMMRFSTFRYYGSYQFLRPSLFVRDLDLIKRITVKDFDHFPDHFNFVSEKADPLVGLNLFNLRGEKWKDMRSTLSPAFTSAKMRAMYTLIQGKRFLDRSFEYFPKSGGGGCSCKCQVSPFLNNTERFYKSLNLPPLDAFSKANLQMSISIWKF